MFHLNFLNLNYDIIETPSTILFYNRPGNDV